MAAATRYRAAALVLLLSGFLQAGAAQARPRPLWELGLGVGAVNFNDYPGAASSHVYVVPVPYLRYRGRFLRADRDGARGVLLERSWLTVNVSAGAAVPVRSRDDAARSGMPNLAATVEIGPALDFHLWRSAAGNMAVDLRVPARLALTVGSRPRSLGWFMAPNLNLDIRHPAGLQGWNLGLLAGPLYATRRYNDYYYSVAPRYVAPGRPAYQADGGYAGAAAVVALSRRFPRCWVGAFLRYQRLDGAVYADSPLVHRHDYLAAGVGVAWVLGHSAHQVEADD